MRIPALPPWRLPKSLAGHAPMAKPVALYALALAGGAFVLEWLEYKYVTRAFATEIYVVLIALAFMGVVLYYGVVALERIFAGWAERSPG